MITKWIVERWNPKTKHYEIVTTNMNTEQIEKVFDYNWKYTRRIIKITEEIVHKEWAGRK